MVPPTSTPKKCVIHILHIILPRFNLKRQKNQILPISSPICLKMLKTAGQKRVYFFKGKLQNSHAYFFDGVLDNSRHSLVDPHILCTYCLPLGMGYGRKIQYIMLLPRCSVRYWSINAIAFDRRPLLIIAIGFKKDWASSLAAVSTLKQSIWKKNFIVIRSNCSSSTLGFNFLEPKVESFRFVAKPWFWFFV